jgi:hypothetical protein
MGYLLAAYSLVLGTLAVYAVRLARRRRALLTQLASPGHVPGHGGDPANSGEAEPGSPGGVSG